MKFLTHGLITFSLIYSMNATADCNFYPQHRTEMINVVIPSTLSIPRDTPDGTVLFESTPVTLNSTPNSVRCTQPYSWGITNYAESSAAIKETLPIGNTGIGWKMVRTSNNTILPIFPASGYSKGGIGFSGNAYSVSLVKIGDISSTSKLPAGVLGYLQYGSVSPIGVNVTGTSFVAQSCETPDVQVDMGQHDISTFRENGSYSASVNFAISLNNCPSGINKVTYRLNTTPSNPAQNSLRGIIKLSADSTAQGIALQILGADGNPVVFYKDYQFSDYSSVGGNFKIPMSARYFRIVETGGNGGFDKGMRAGTANASASFIMSYL